MRRKDREVTDRSEILQMIRECNVVRLGFADGDFPYIVPVNFVPEIDGEQINLYFHGAKTGRKAELIRKLGACSFEMDQQLKIDCIAKDRNVTTRYKCVMGTADMEILDEAESYRVMEDIFMPGLKEARGFDYDHSSIGRAMVVKMAVRTVTAKCNPLIGEE